MSFGNGRHGLRATTRGCSGSTDRRSCTAVVAKTKEGDVGLDDKIDNKSEELGGKAKEATGKATDDESLEAEGKADQTSSNLKQAGEKVKDAFTS
jgi:uncharacterized protein YjbJ (UPF0337 family)